MTTISTYVDIDLDDALDDDHLVKEVLKRELVGDVIAADQKRRTGAKPDKQTRQGNQPSDAEIYDEWCDELRAAIAGGDLLHVEVLLARRRPFVAAVNRGLLEWRPASRGAVDPGTIHQPAAGSA